MEEQRELGVPLHFGVNLQLLGHRDTDPTEVSVLVACEQLPGCRAFLDQVKEYLPESSRLSEVSSHARVLQMATISRPDVLVLDATRGRWPEPDFGQRLGYRAAVIFVVDDPAAAQHAFDAGAIDCLLYPVQPERLARAFQRAFTWMAGNRAPALTQSTFDAPSTTAAGRPSRWLRIQRNRDLVVAQLDDIVYLQAERKVTRVVLADTDGYLRLGINNVAEHLDTRQFWRIHRGTIVNGNHVSVVQQDDLGRVLVRLRGRTETLMASRVHEKMLLRDGIF